MEEPAADVKTLRRNGLRRSGAIRERRNCDSRLGGGAEKVTDAA
jgi:hypothetical protein